MPKPNKKRIEAKKSAQDPRLATIDASKIDVGTISAARIKAGSIPLVRINLDDLARELGLDDPIENSRKTRPRKTTED